MSDSMTPPPPLQLAEQAMERLKRVAEGNDVAQDFVKLVDKEEKVYSLIGKMLLVPGCDVQTNHYIGPVRNKKSKIFPNIASMREAALVKQQSMSKEDKWVNEAAAELAAAPGQGWGVDGAKVVLPSYTEVFSATDNCPSCNNSRLITCQQCHGQKRTMCLYCKGQGRENCPNCFGRGEDPTNPTRHCPICNGMRLTPCRYCQATGWISCQTCQGRGGIPCSTCKGEGRITEELSITGYAETNFRISKDQDLPSGLLRGLDRIGMTDIYKGHADVTMLPPAEDKDDKTAKFTVRYNAQIPYADLKIRFGDDRIVLISAFGKKGLMLGCPLFLDKALKEARTMLASAAQGEIPLEQALTTRVVRDALSIELSGKNSDKSNGTMELRKIYPIGLSPIAIREIFRNISSSIELITRRSRIITSAAILCLSITLLGGIFLTPHHANLTAGLSKELVLLVDFIILVAMLSLARIGMWQSARIALARAFPNEKLPIKQNIGKVGNGLLAAVFTVYVVCLWLAPIKPWWLAKIMGIAP